VLSIHDRLLGTFTASDRALSVVYGLDDANPRRLGSLPGLLTMPFERDEPGGMLAAPDTIVRM
jgi:hypothetical protein